MHYLVIMPGNSMPGNSVPGNNRKFFDEISRAYPVFYGIL